jgi:hypothetical protein
VNKLLEREQVSVLPPAWALLRKVEAERAAIWAMRDEANVRMGIAALNAEIAKVNARAIEGPPTRRGPLDVEAIVRDWRPRSTTR